MLRLSFIVPFYNVELYIEECIRSLYNQDIPQSEYEVICVDDCSQDSGRSIVERLQKEYPTLKLLTTPENLRQGGARNLGLKHAQGRYIWFVDSDDTIIPNCLAQMLELTEAENLDLLRISSQGRGGDGSCILYGPCTGSQYVFDAPIKEKTDQRCCSVCMGIIRRQLLIENNIWFTEKVQYEDDDYAYMFYAFAERMMAIPLSAYIIRYRQGSTTTKVSLQSIGYLREQIKRLIVKEKTLKNFDSRWSGLIRTNIKWTCEGQIIPRIKKLSLQEEKQFYKQQLGRIDGLSHFVSFKIYLSMRYHVFYKWFNLLGYV